MTDGVIYGAGWTLDDVEWSCFEPAKVDAGLLAAVKAASLVEYNAPDYVAYLKRVYQGAPDSTIRSIEHWGEEEIQHGRALARWAEIADPTFDFNHAFARFRTRYRPAHFDGANVSVRGSKRGEMIARCVVESGTSSFYSAIRDASAEPVLKEGHGSQPTSSATTGFSTTSCKRYRDQTFRMAQALVAVTAEGIRRRRAGLRLLLRQCAPRARKARDALQRRTYARAYHDQAMPLYAAPHRKLVKMW